MLLNKRIRILLATLLVFIILIQTSYADICEVAKARDVLRKNIYLYLTNPASSPLTIEQLRDLLISYLGISAGATTFDCSIIGSTSSKSISIIITNGDSAPNFIPACSDNTKYGDCSDAKPKFCYGGTLVNRCSYCGCSSGNLCNDDRSCTPAGSNITCFNNLDCGQSMFTGSYYCSNDYVTKDFLNYTCLNPGTINSNCSSSTSMTTLNYCDPSLNQSCVNGSSTCQTLNQSLTCSDGTQNNQCSSTKPLYCSNGTLNNNCLSCGCLSDQTCLGTGSCQQSDACADSDNGISPYSFGYSYGSQNSSFKNQSDYCASNTTLTESFCAGNKINITTVICGYQCANGACSNLTNQNPVAIIILNITGINLTVKFNATASYDSDGYISSYIWYFGDGNISNSSFASHKYPSKGTYEVNLTVIDNQLSYGGSSQSIKVT